MSKNKQIKEKLLRGHTYLCQVFSTYLMCLNLYFVSVLKLLVIMYVIINFRQQIENVITLHF